MSNLEGVEWSKWEMVLSVLLEGYAHWMGSTVVSGTVMSISSPLMSSLMCYRTVIMQANRLGLLQYRGNGGHFKAGGDARSKIEVNIRSNCSEHDLSTHPGIPSGPVAFLLLTLLRALLSPQCQQCSHDCRCCWPQILFPPGSCPHLLNCVICLSNQFRNLYVFLECILIVPMYWCDS